jgi:hypothetical protein
MSIIQTLVVRNAADITVDAIRFHLETGVDHFILTDHKSTDGLRDKVTEFIDQGVLSYLYRDDMGFDQSAWVTEMVNMAHHDLGAQWVINSDCDEFWVAKDGGTLRDVFENHPSTDVFIANRHDFVCLDHISGPFWDDMIYRKAVSRNLTGLPLPPKVAHRSATGLVVDHGNHHVNGFAHKTSCENALEVLHFPIRSYDQYKEKIIVGEAALSSLKHVGVGIGAHWRSHAAEIKETGEIDFLNNAIHDQDAIENGVQNGELVKDTRVRDVMQNICPMNIKAISKDTQTVDAGA